MSDVLTHNVGVLSVVFMKEDEHWVAQCLEYDIVAQSKSLKKLPDAFCLAFVSHMAVRMANKQEPFEGVPPAPAKYWGLFNKEALPLKRQLRNPIPPQKNTPPVFMPSLDARVADVVHAT